MDVEGDVECLGCGGRRRRVGLAGGRIRCGQVLRPDRYRVLAVFGCLADVALEVGADHDDLQADWQYFGHDRCSSDQVGNIDEKTRAVFVRSYAGAPDELAEDAAIAAADTLLLTVPNQLGVDDNAHVSESILKLVAPRLGWR